MIDKATVQRIKDAADIVEVVSDYVHLTRRGGNYMGLCPFHNERTPSFSVNKRRNFCYCFSCHKGGSPVNFIMEKEGISYHDALLQLAKKYGIKVEERELTDEERKLATEREGLMIAAEWAMKQMENDLVNTQDGRDIGLSYLYSRGVTEEAIRKFHLGYALDKGSHLTPMMLNAGFELDVLRALGVTGQSQSGNLYDKYRGRVIFPIMNSSGKVVGFGGRDLKGGPAKYINSPESPLYHKNNELYGIYQAKTEIVRQDKCFLVEGYLDVISMWQSGMQNTVASSGTALTDGQIAIIHRFTNNITLLYDGDSAGIKAALRGINMLLSHKMKVTVLLLPDGDDPDSFARKHTPEEFRDYVASHETDIIRFKMQVLMADAGDNLQKRSQAINSVIESIACIPDDVERSLYIQECSRQLGIDEATVAHAAGKARYAIVQQQRQERNRRQAERDYPLNSGADATQNGNASGDTAANAANAIEGEEGNAMGNVAGGAIGENGSTGAYTRITSAQRESHTRTEPAVSPIEKVERNIIDQMVRYGFMPFNLDSDNDEQEATDESGNENDDISYMMLDFIRDELDADSIKFSVPAYSNLYDCLRNRIDEFLIDRENFRLKIEDKIAKAREEGRIEISHKCSSISDIEQAERKLEEELTAMRERELMEFARFYPGDYLASHENSEIRRLANEAINEKYVLSNIFTAKSSQNEEEAITLGVIRAMTEWKNEILNEHLASLMDKFRRESGKDPDEDMKMMQQINRIMSMRSQVAKNIGDRILYAKRR